MLGAGTPLWRAAAAARRPPPTAAAAPRPRAAAAARGWADAAPSPSYADDSFDDDGSDAGLRHGGRGGYASDEGEYSSGAEEEEERDTSYNGDPDTGYFDEISSLQNEAVKHCVKVRSSPAYRRDAGSVLVVGEGLVREVAPLAPLRALFFLRGDAPPPLRAARAVAVTEGVMRKLAGLESVAPGALAAEAEAPRRADLFAAPVGSLKRVLALERCQDPGNLGTLLRTAAALGWDAAFLLPGCADPLGDKALRAGRGAAFKLPLGAGSLEDLAALAARHGLARVAAEPRAGGAGVAAGAPRAAAGARAPAAGVCLVLGSEGQGLSAEARALCTPVGIEMPGDMESLNVAAAGAILMAFLSEGAPRLAEDLTAVRGGGEPARALM